jgi:HSP20 family protein
MSTTRRERVDAQRREQTQRHERQHEAHRQREEGQPSSPFSLMHQGIDELDRWFQRLTGGRESSPSWMSPTSWMQQAAERMGDWSPAIETFQRGSEFVIRADVPGMTRTDLHIEAGDDSITISGERKQEQREEREGAFWSERMYGSFSRTIPLPAGAIPESARATFTNGVLEIVLQAPSPEARRGRKIDISGS